MGLRGALRHVPSGGAQLLGALDYSSRMKSDIGVDRRTAVGTPHPTWFARQLAATRNLGMFLDADTKALESEN